jgi:transcriptional regulator with XRE-family HTH domain/archaellum biogenesis ATPase FlaH
MNTQTSTLLRYKTAKDWFASTEAKPAPKALCGHFWHEGELAIMFADTGLGKSVLAVQIANSIAESDSDASDIFACKSEGRTVLYLDFELTDKQFELRYSGENDDGEAEHMAMSDRFLRGTIDLYADVPDGMTFTQYLMQEIERCIDETGARVLIVDNISFLRGSQTSVHEATAMMRDLRRLMERREVSILVLAHTPKRIARRPLTLNDLQGSKALSNFADSIFAIGESCLGPDIRYIKQLKCRSREIVYDAGYVPGLMILKTGASLDFEHVAFGTELSHLKDFDAAHRLRHERWTEIDRLRRTGLSQREIADKLDVSAATVNRYISTYVSYPDASGAAYDRDLYKCYGFAFRRGVTKDKQAKEDAQRSDRRQRGQPMHPASSERRVNPDETRPNSIFRIMPLPGQLRPTSEELKQYTTAHPDEDEAGGYDHQQYLRNTGLIE